MRHPARAILFPALDYFEPATLTSNCFRAPRRPAEQHDPDKCEAARTRSSETEEVSKPAQAAQKRERLERRLAARRPHACLANAPQ